jgi:high-affinity nickel-transport protein
MRLSRAIFDDCRAALRVKIIGLYGGLVIVNLLAWGWAAAAFYDRQWLLGTALIAYGFGLRHAVDADHIAAIDNVTRKLMQEGKRPIGVGFFFALGHSTVVVLGSIVIVLTASTLQSRFPGLIETGSLLGTLVSATFLFFIAAINIMVLAGIFRLFRRVRRGGTYTDEALALLLGQRGVLGRLFRPLLRLMSRSWHMYPLGFLFGLGFDTATEIGVLGISAAAASKGLSLWSILVFPALFTAGMSLVDASDGVLMLGAYGWAFVNPARKLVYNFAITFISVIAAVAVGGVEVLGLLAGKLGSTGGIWDTINLGTLGYLIVGIFIAGWLVSFAIYRSTANEGSARGL